MPEFEIAFGFLISVALVGTGFCDVVLGIAVEGSVRVDVSIGKGFIVVDGSGIISETVVDFSLVITFSVTI